MPLGYLLIANLLPEEWHAEVSEVSGESQLIGRSPKCDIVIPGKYCQVSRKHASIEFRRQELWIRDEGSTGGTTLNSVPVFSDRPTRLMVGDRICLGGLVLFLVSGDAKIMQNVGEQAPSIIDETRSSSSDSQRIGLSHTDFENCFRSLSPAELEVLRWIDRGLMTDKEIGLKLFRSPHTVRTQLCSIFQKLEVHSREQLLGLLKHHEIAWTKSAPSNGQDNAPQPTDLNISIKDIPPKKSRKP